jgi:hypothetical protein
LSFSTVRAALTRDEVTRWPHSEEKQCSPTHGIAELDDLRREARQQARRRMHSCGVARHVAEHSAMGIGDGAAMASG